MLTDLTIEIDNHPGALAAVGETLGRAGVSIEGGGAWTVGATGTAHFLVDDSDRAQTALSGAGLRVTAARPVVTVRLRQDEPGQLGKLTRRMSDAGVNIEVLYSDHQHQLVLVVDRPELAQQVSDIWMRETSSTEDRLRTALIGPRPSRAALLDEEHWARAALTTEPAPTAVKEHRYAVSVVWTGNDGTGTASYRSYRREHTVRSGQKAPILASSDPAFRGDRGSYSPEELLVSALSGCHMLWYLHVCSVNGVVVTDYRDEPIGTMAEETTGAGQFTGVTLRPRVRITPQSDPTRATTLHTEAHAHCFIARSVNFPIRIEPAVTKE